MSSSQLKAKPAVSGAGVGAEVGAAVPGTSSGVGAEVGAAVPSLAQRAASVHVSALVSVLEEAVAAAATGGPNRRRRPKIAKAQHKLPAAARAPTPL